MMAIFSLYFCLSVRNVVYIVVGISLAGLEMLNNLDIENVSFTGIMHCHSKLAPKFGAICIYESIQHTPSALP